MTVLYMELPFPPSINTYWRNIAINGRPRTIMSEKGRTYRQHVLNVISFEPKHPPMTGRIKLTIELSAPDRRIRDLDNYPKAILDGLTHAGLWRDDSQVDELTIKRMPPKKPGYAKLVIEALSE